MVAEQAALYRAPALDKGLDILELLSGQPGWLTRAEIVRLLGRSPGEIYRMLERLVLRGYVTRSVEGDRYVLSIKLFALAHRHPPLRRLLAPAQPLMDAFAGHAGQSCHLVIADGDAGLVVAQASCPGGWEFGLRIGARIDLLSTGSGQMLLATTAPDRLAVLQQGWSETGRGRLWTALAPELARFRGDGYRSAPSRQIVGVRDISVPIPDAEGHAIAVLTCPCISRLDETAVAFDTIVQALLAVARALAEPDGRGEGLMR